MTTTHAIQKLSYNYSHTDKISHTSHFLQSVDQSVHPSVHPQTNLSNLFLYFLNGLLMKQQMTDTVVAETKASELLACVHINELVSPTMLLTTYLLQPT
jgi:hypothetical protein